MHYNICPECGAQFDYEPYYEDGLCDLCCDGIVDDDYYVDDPNDPYDDFDYYDDIDDRYDEEDIK